MIMTTAVHVIWWVALGLALVATLFATAFLVNIVRLCGNILELARRTVPAAQGIARNTSAIANLSVVIALAPTLLSVAGATNGHAETIGSTLESVAPKGER
ncbi:MAG: hypothetical protein NVSMB68_15500 [Thermoanaerobaculia bacterium]